MTPLRVLGWTCAFLLTLPLALHVAFLVLAWRWRRRLNREGVAGLGLVSGIGYDLHLYRTDPDRRVPCRVHVTWTSERDGRQYRLATPWFWTDPLKELVHPERIPLRVVPSAPETHYEIDLSVFGIGIAGTGNELWRTGRHSTPERRRAL